jgi:haloalkane dehalogenase
VMLHGFPDNLHIYDYVVPYLTAAGRRVVVFDFLGFGRSEKVAPGSYHYNFDQQVGDLSAVVDALKVEKFIPVGHDSGGPCVADFSTAVLTWRGTNRAPLFSACSRSKK